MGATLHCGAWASHCSGFSCCRAWALGVQASVVVARGLSNAGSVVVARGLSCSAACGIFPDQGSNPCPLHWQADSSPLHHRGSPPNHIPKSHSNHSNSILPLYFIFYNLMLGEYKQHILIKYLFNMHLTLKCCVYVIKQLV